MKTDDTYMRGLAAAGFSVNDIDYVMCTHLHVDHVGWNTRLENGRWVPTFPKARYVFGKQEHRLLDGGEREEGKPGLYGQRAAGRRGGPRRGRDERPSDRRSCPAAADAGHTPGHVAVCFGKGSDEAVVSGDLMHSPLQTRYPELSVNFDVDKEQSAETRRSFLERYCDTKTLCCTAHFPSPSAGRIKRWGDGFKCEMVGA